MAKDVKWLANPSPGLKSHVMRIVDVATFVNPDEIADDESPARFALSAMIHATVIMLRGSMLTGDSVRLDEVTAGLEWAMTNGGLGEKEDRSGFAVPVEDQRRRVTLYIDGRCHEATVILESPNGKSLALQLDCVITLGGGCATRRVTVGGLALSQCEDGTYREVLTGVPVTMVRHEAS